MKQDAKEIEDLLKYGAYAFIDPQNQDEANKLWNMNIDDILNTT